MSRLQDTKRAYDKISSLLDQEIRKRSGSAQELQRFRQTLDVAFYLLGWGQFEYLVRREAEVKIEENARTRTINSHAWSYLKDNVKNLSVLRRLDLIFHDHPTVRASLDKEYTVRNEAAHDYKLPNEARDVSEWLERLEALVSQL
jgi:hypothetical protein